MSASIFLDYCLTCNRQIEAAGEVYCSQQCRLADLCTSTGNSNACAVPPTPYTHQSTSHNHSTSVGSTVSTVSTTSSQRNSSHFVLPPAYDFSSHRNSTISVSSSQSSGSSATSAPMNAPAPRPASGYFAYAGSNNVLLSSSEAAKKTLSPTSSRSSITSTDDVRAELRMYESGFDQVRDWRRRRTSVYENTWRN